MDEDNYINLIRPDAGHARHGQIRRRHRHAGTDSQTRRAGRERRDGRGGRPAVQRRGKKPKRLSGERHRRLRPHADAALHQAPLQ